MGGPYGQEGAHRMEALRQMGHGDTKVPVMNFHSDKERGENPDKDFQQFQEQDRLLYPEDYD